MTKITWTNETRKLSELKPWPRNPRQLKNDQAKRLAESFDEFGQVETIAIGPDNEIYNGHQRLNVLMQKHGGNYEVECRVSSRELTEKEREKLTVYLHKGAAGEWDFDVLANEFELDELLEWGFDKKELDLDLWGDDKPEDPGAQIDKAEELREKWGVESGQLWQLGEHRLICGDCTDIPNMARLWMDEYIDAIITDPPYGIGIANWDVAPSKDFIDLLLGNTNGPVVLFGGSQIESLQAFIEYGAERCLIWNPDFKLSASGKNHIFYRWTPIWVWRMPEKIMNIWCDVLHHSTDLHNFWNHNSTKPIDLITDIVEGFTKESDSVYDPFLGSGTTLIARERLGRKCRAIEISPAYCAVAIQRWVDMTHGEPKLME